IAFEDTVQDAITLAMLEFEPMATQFVRSGCTMEQDAVNAAILEFDSMVTHLVSASTQPDSSNVSKKPWKSEGPWKHAVHPLSLRGLIRKHGQVLYAEPLAWTELHLELLSCSFSFSDCDKTYLDPEDPPRLGRHLVRIVCELPKVQQLLLTTLELEDRLPMSDRAFTLQRILHQFDMRSR
ncbi:Rabenosyn-5, partial [Ascosphaera pollenicola]